MLIGDGRERESPGPLRPGATGGGSARRSGGPFLRPQGPLAPALERLGTLPQALGEEGPQAPRLLLKGAGRFGVPLRRQHPLKRIASAEEEDQAVLLSRRGHMAGA